MKKKDPSITPREAITATAVRLFAEHGYTGTTMRDIAKAVGVLPGSLYAHIDSKETLLLEIVQDGIERFLSIEDTLKGSEESATQRLLIAVKAHVGHVAESPARMSVVFHQWRYLNDKNRASAAAMRRRYAQTFMRIVESGMAAGEFSAQLDKRIAVFAILGALNWTPEWFNPAGPLTAEEVAAKLADFAIWGLRCGSLGNTASAPPSEPTSSNQTHAAAERKRSR